MTRKVFLPLIFLGSSLLLALQAMALSVPNVTLSTSTVNTGAQYTISCRPAVSSSLSAGTDTITIVFPNDTHVPASMLASQITVGATALAAAPTIAGQSVTLVTPIAVNNGSPANVVFDVAAGLVNPSFPQNYQVQESTSKEASVNSNNYSVTASATAVTAVTFTPNPTTVNTAAQYTINFTTGAAGFLAGGTGLIRITFPNDTTLPASIPAGQITVNGANPAGASTSAGQVLTITTPSDCPASTAVQVIISSAANLINPSLPGAAYQGIVTTSAQTNNGTSSNYTITSSATAVTALTATPAPATVNTSSQYTITFNTGAAGALGAGTGLIHVIFPANTTVPGSIAAGALVKVNTVNCAVVSTGSGQTLTITTPVDINGSSAVTIVIAAGGNVVNPSTPNTYTLQANTSAQSNNATSGGYGITASATAVTALTASPAPSTVSTASAYTITFNTGAAGALVIGGQIILTFPSDTSVPANIAAGALLKVNTVNATVASTGSGQTLTITTPVAISSGAGVTIVIAAGANLINPSTPGATYQLQAITTAQTTPANSGNYSITASGTAVTALTTTPNPTTVNTASQYIVTFTTGAAGALGAGTGQIFLTFPANTTVPANIPSGGQITVNSNNIAVPATGAGQVLTITTPIAIGNNTAVTVVISVGGSSLVNPSTPGASYNLTATTSTQTGVATSGNYTIAASATAVTGLTASPVPATVGVASAYTINFTTGAAGALVAGEQINLIFPSDTTVPANIAAGALVKVNTINTIVASTGSGQTLTITTPVAIGGSSAVTIVIAAGANLVNPTTPGNYTMQANTQAQSSNATSGNYSITGGATAVTGVTATPNPATVNTASQYTIGFTTGAAGSLGAGTGQINITFPSDTGVPGSIPAGAQVRVNGVNTSVASTGSGQTLTVTTPNAIGNNTAVTVVINTGASNIVNPSFPNNYTLQVNTSTQTTNAASGAYTISASATAVSAVSAAPNPTTVNTNSQYTILFTTGAAGALAANTGLINITFPSDTGVPGSIAAGAQVRVNGINTAVASTGSGQTLTITTPVAIGASSIVTIIINTGGANVVNPSFPANYALTVNTSAQSNNGTSGNYAITASGTAVTGLNVTPNPTTVNTNSQYTITFTTGAAGALGAGTGQIHLTFPSDTGVPANIPAGAQVRVNANNTTVATTGAGQVLTITTPINIGNNVAVTVIINPGASNLVNPSAPATYNMTATTSAQSSPATSGNYSITASASAVTGVSATPNPSTVNTNSQYTVNFNTGAAGALGAGVGIIHIIFPANTTVPVNIGAGQITVNGVPTGVAATGAGQTLTITTPVAIGSNSAVAVVINTGANNLVNPPIPNNYTLQVNTSTQTGNGTSGNYSITASATTLVVGAVSVTPATIGNFGAYNFNFNTAADGALLAGVSQLIINFPAGTLVPGSPAVGGLTVGGTQVAAAAGSGTTLTLTLNGSIAGSTNNVAVVIPVGSGIRNPTTVNTYSFTVSTSAQPAGTSGNYNIGVSGTQLVVGAASAAPNTIGNIGAYNFVFNTSADGALVGTVSTISITFPAGTVIPGSPSVVGLTVGGQQVDAASGSGTTLTLTVHQDITASTNNVAVVIPVGSGIRNPTAGGTYNLSVSTSVQTTAGFSGNYTIGVSGTALVVNGVSVTPSTVGNNGAYSFTFNTANDGALVGTVSTLAISFPAGTVVPNGVLSTVGLMVGGQTVDSANGSGQTITVVIHQTIPAATNNIAVALPVTLGIRNPTTGGIYHLTASTSVQTTPGNSGNYTIGLSGTNLAINPPVIVTPNTVGNVASYSFTFNTSADGALVGTISTIAVTFPAGTSVPTGALSVTGLTVGGTQVDTANGAGQTITLAVHQDIPASTNTINITLPAGLNIQNPTTSGNYQLTVSTSVQPSGNSTPYAIGSSGSTLAIGAVIPTPNVIGNNAAYSFTFNTSADGALVGHTSQLIIFFPGTTWLPNGARPTAGLTIGGLVVDSATGSGNNTLTLTLQQSIPVSTNNIAVVIPAGVGIINPTSVSATYQLTAWTSVQLAGQSPNYTIGVSATKINGITVAPNTSIVGSDANYAVGFANSADGALVGGTSHIFITFPDDTVVPGTYTGVTVNGVAVTSATGAGRTVNIVPAQNLAGAIPGGISVFIPGLQNPTYASAGNTVAVSTSPQPAPADLGYSPAYSIDMLGTAVSIANITLSSTVVSSPSTYNFNLTLRAVQRANKGQIIITFPPSTLVANGAFGGATINSVPVASAIGNQAGAYIVLVPGGDLPATPSGPITYPVSLPAAAVPLNSSMPGTNTLSVQTTAQGPGNGNYTLITDNSVNKTISKPNVSNVPDTAGAPAQYTITFNTGLYGRLSPGNLINLQFPVGTTVPLTFTAGTITINGIGNTGTIYATGLAVKLVVPPGVTVGNNGGLVTIVFLSTPPTIIGISNPALAQYGWNLVNCYTDVEPTPVNSNYYTTTSTSFISTPTVTVTPPVIFAHASYQIDFHLGAGGSLAAGGSSIFITFPVGTTVPSSFPTGTVTVNGSPASTMYIHSTYQVEIVSPVAVTNFGAVTVLFSNLSGLINPSVAGTFTLKAHTTLESQDVVSTPYIISASSTTTISQPQVDLFPLFTHSAGHYKINFNLGALGGLVGGVSTVNITFPAAFQLPTAIPAGLITINGQPTTVPATSAAQVLSIVVPQNLAVSSPVEIMITSHAGIINPADAGDYFLTLYTSSEPTPMQSNTFHLNVPTWSDIIVYPNPITKKDSTNKAFTFFLIPADTATLRVYTLDGHLVKAITKNDTSDRMTWDLNNEQGSQIASGIYLYVITGPGGSKKGKLAVKN